MGFLPPFLAHLENGWIRGSNIQYVSTEVIPHYELSATVVAQRSKCHHASASVASKKCCTDESGFVVHPHIPPSKIRILSLTPQRNNVSRSGQSGLTNKVVGAQAHTRPGAVIALNVSPEVCGCIRDAFTTSAV